MQTKGKDIGPLRNKVSPYFFVAQILGGDEVNSDPYC